LYIYLLDFPNQHEFVRNATRFFEVKFRKNNNVNEEN